MGRLCASRHISGHEGIRSLQARFDNRPWQARIVFRRGSLAHPPDRELLDAGHPTSQIEELVVYRYDERFLNDEPEDANDHACDAKRYVARHVDRTLASRPDAGPSTNHQAEPLPDYLK